MNFTPVLLKIIEGAKIMDNRWLVEIFEKDLFRNAVTPAFQTNLSNWLDEIDNASAWAGYWHGDSSYWLDTHIYTHKQIHERAMRFAKAQEERHQKWLKANELQEE